MKREPCRVKSEAAHNRLRHPDIWRPRQPVVAANETLATGFPVLDEALPGGGWPVGALTEILSAAEGIGELRLLMPAFARLGGEGRWIMWISPPYIPYAPALIHQGLDLSRVLWVRAGTEADSLWAGEQALRSGACGAVSVWARERYEVFAHLRIIRRNGPGIPPNPVAGQTA